MESKQHHLLASSRTDFLDWAVSFLGCILIAIGLNTMAAETLPLHGKYDGSYDPASTSPPAGCSKCLVAVGEGCSIKANCPVAGEILIDKTGNKGAVSITIPQNLQADFQGRPMETEYEFSVRFAALTSGIANAPAITCGFFDEGGTGCRVTLAWYKTAADERLIALNGVNQYPLSPVSTFNWEDGKPHLYTVQKYRDTKSGKMVLQVLIDGVPQFKDPILYGSNMTLIEPWKNSIAGGHTGFQFRTGDAAAGRFVLDEMSYGPLGKIPDMPAQDGIALSALKNEWSKPIPGPWLLGKSGDGEGGVDVQDRSVRLSVNGSVRATSGEMTLKPNRSYTIKGSCTATGDVSSIELQFDQYKKTYPLNTPPFQMKKLPGGGDSQTISFEFPVYQRITNNLATLAIQAKGNGTVTLSDLSISGGGHFPINYLTVLPEQPGFEEGDIENQIAAYPGPQKLKVENRNGNFLLRSPEDWIVPMFYNGRAGTKANGSWWGAMGQAGIHLQSVAVGMPTGDIPRFWIGKEKYDFSGVEKAIKLVLSRDLSAKILLQFYADPYEGWCLENSTEICQNSKGQYAWGVQHFASWGGISEKNGSVRLLPSIMSSKAKSDIVASLRALDDWLNSSPLGRAVVGYYICGFNDGDFGHWVHPGTAAGQKEPDDYSPGAQNSWRAWLKEKYGGDIAKLNSAWGSALPDFESLSIPSPERRRFKGTGNFPWIPEKENSEVVDFNRFYGEACGDFLGGIVSQFKELTGSGRFFVSHVGNPMHGWRGYTGYGKLLKSRALDMITATADYGCRRPGYAGGANLMPESIGLQNQIAIHEIDHRTHTDPSHYEGMDFNVGRSEDAGQFRSILFRDGMNMISRGHSLYFFDMSGENFGDPAVTAAVGDLRKIAEQQLPLSGPPRADVAYFIGEDSINYLGDNEEANRFLMRMTRRQREQWDTAGVPYHLYLQRDLTDKALPKYKVYIFVLPQKISAEERDAIDRLKCDGNTLVFLHAPGICNSADMDQTISELTGIRATRIPGTTTPLAGSWIPGDHPLTTGLEGRFGDRPLYGNFSDRESRGLAFAIADPNATPLAKYRDSDKIAAGCRDFGTWRSIYLAVPWLDAQFINNIARAGGAWSVAEPHDAVFANQHLITIHALSGGKKTLRPRYPSKITDATTGEVIAEKSGEFSVDIPFGQTRVFRTEALPNPR